MQDAISIWRWLLAEIPLFHVVFAFVFYSSLSCFANFAVHGNSLARWDGEFSVLLIAGVTVGTAGFKEVCTTKTTRTVPVLAIARQFL